MLSLDRYGHIGSGEFCAAKESDIKCAVGKRPSKISGNIQTGLAAFMLSGPQLNPTARTLRQFAGAWFVIFAAAALRQFFHGHKAIGTALVVIGLLGLAGLVKPLLVKHLFIGATIAAFPLGWVLTQLMLAIMFYGVLTPVALVYRLRKRDPLQLRRSEKSSFWRPRGEPPPESYLKQF